jgi:hypothetical protein
MDVVDAEGEFLCLTPFQNGLAKLSVTDQSISAHNHTAPSKASRIRITYPCAGIPAFYWASA